MFRVIVLDGEGYFLEEGLGHMHTALLIVQVFTLEIEKSKTVV